MSPSNPAALLKMKRRLCLWIRIGAAAAILLSIALAWGKWETAASIAFGISFLTIGALYTVELSVNRRMWASSADR